MPVCDMSKTFFDGHYYVEDVAEARISNILSHDGIKLTDKQHEDIKKIIRGAVLGYLIGTDGYRYYVACRKDRGIIIS